MSETQRDIVIIDKDIIHRQLKSVAAKNKVTITRLGTELIKRALSLNLSNDDTYAELSQVKPSGTDNTGLLLRRALELNLADELVYPTLIEQAKQQGQSPADYLMALVTEKMG